MSRFEVLIIGLGNLGKRHLQSFSLLEQGMEIDLIDINKAVCEDAISFFKSLESKNQEIELRALDNFKDLKKHYDFVIIATTAKPRAFLINELMSNSDFDSLLLEKVLFNNIDEYEQVSELLKNKKVYVNTSRRMMPFHRSLKDVFNGEKVNGKVKGNSWGMMSNIIHFLDFFSYLNNTCEFQVNLENINKKLIPAKREGYFELFGSLKATFDNGAELVIDCSDNPDVAINIELDSSEKNYLLNELQKNVVISDKQSGKKTEEAIIFPFQSEMTKTVAEQVFTKSQVLLPTFEESKTIHLNLINELSKFIKANFNGDYDDFPFT